MSACLVGTSNLEGKHFAQTAHCAVGLSCWSHSSVFDRFIELPEWPSADDDMEDDEDALDVAGWPFCGQGVMVKRNRKAEKLPLPSNAIILTIYIEDSFKMT